MRILKFSHNITKGPLFSIIDRIRVVLYDGDHHRFRTLTMRLIFMVAQGRFIKLLCPGVLSPPSTSQVYGKSTLLLFNRHHHWQASDQRDNWIHLHFWGAYKRIEGLSSFITTTSCARSPSSQSLPFALP